MAILFTCNQKFGFTMKISQEDTMLIKTL